MISVVLKFKQFTIFDTLEKSIFLHNYDWTEITINGKTEIGNQDGHEAASFRETWANTSFNLLRTMHL